MIITKEMIHSVTCEESIAWFDQHPFFYNLERKDFKKMLREYEKQGKTPNNWWGDWADENFIKGEAIVHGKKLKRLGMYKVEGPNLTPQELDNIDEALTVLQAAKDTQFKTEDQFFQVQVRHRRGPGGYEIIKFCDTTLDTCDVTTADEYFSTFNINTGAYEDYPTYAEAKNRMIQIRSERDLLYADSFMVYEKIAEIGAPDINGEDYVPVQTLKGSKTEQLYIIDRIEKRPDPKPKKPKP